MSKQYYIEEKYFTKMKLTVNKIFDLAIASDCFAEKYIKNNAEEEHIITLLKYLKYEADKLLCMFLYLETGDKDMENVFSR